jgi:ABC-type uncharacterized transport system substrate-binding protein
MSCFRTGIAAVAAMLLAGIGAEAQDAPPKRIFHLDSYHQGYSISDDTAIGMDSVLKGKPVQITRFYLDTKRKGTDADIRESVAKARAAIDKFKPDVLVTSDDAAVKYVVVPFYKNGPYPVVYCGVNWSSDAYALPKTQATGMVEVVPILEVLDLARRYYPRIKRLGVLSEDSLSEQNHKALLEPKYQALGFQVTSVLVPDYASWKREFARLQDAVDIVYVPTQAAVKGWDAADAKAFVGATVKKPVVATDEFMMPYAVIGLVKTQVEQGEFAARVALELLSGRKPADIPEVRNRRRKTFVNRTLAKAINFVPGPDLAGVTVD